MIAKLRYEEGVLLDLVDDAVFIGDAAGPVAGEGVFEGFGLALADKRHALYVADQQVDPLHDLFIVFLPVEVVLPGVLRDNQLQSTNSRAVPWPASSCMIDSIKRRAFLGLRNR